MTVYKVSYVIKGSDDPGTIANSDKRPQVGEQVTLGERKFEIIEVIDLLPSRGDFQYIHATCRLLDNGENSKETPEGPVEVSGDT
jgi:hypothetical protein